MRMYKVVMGALVAALLAGPVAAQTGMVAAGSAPGKASVAETVEVQGTIAAIDSETRAVTLKGENGKEVSVEAGPEVRNFAQLKVGDTVTITMTQALTLELKKGSTAVVSRTDDAAGARAAEGEQPGGVIGRKVTIMAEVTAVDAETRSVTLQGPKQSVELTVKDPAQFALISVGDRIEATYVEAAAVSVEPVKQKD